MNEYTIYFNFFGKKMKHTIEATDKYEAEDKLKDKIIIDSIKLINGAEPSPTSQPFPNMGGLDPLKDVFGFLNKGN